MKNIRNNLANLLAVAIVLLVAYAFKAYSAEVDSTMRLFDREQTNIHTGSAVINSATADYSKWQPIVTITPENTHAVYDCRVVLDLAKASTGFGAVYTSATITATVQRKVDGANWRSESNNATATVTGTLAGAASEGLSLSLLAGTAGNTESLRIAVRVSAVNNTNVTIPYVVYYRSGAKATITPAN